MAESPNLAITHVATNQANKEVTINDGFTNIDKAITDVFAVDMATADAVLAITDLQRAITIAVSNPGVGHSLTIAATKRLFVVHNTDDTNSVDVVVGATSVTVDPETLALLYMDGTTDGLWAVASGGSGGGATTLLGLSDTPATYGTAGQALVVNGTLDGLVFATIAGGGSTTFLALTDTPSTYTGSETYLARVNAAGDALEFIDVATLGLSSGASYAVPFKGVVTPGSALTTQDISALTEIAAFGSPLIDTDGFYNGTNPGRVYVPAGISKMKVTACVSVALATAGEWMSAHLHHVTDAGATDTVIARSLVETGSTDEFFTISGPVTEVVEDDYFYIAMRVEADTSVTINGYEGTFIQGEVVELTTATGRPYDLSFFTSGLPSASALVFQHVAARPFTVPATAENSSQGYGNVAATALASFTITKNGVSIGTMDFAAAGQTATFTVATATDFAIGDVLGVVAPSSQDATLADVSATLLVNLT